ncbi:MAG: heavy-metal-associated domain-containing protein [Myxococcota bacterium]
MEDPDETLFDVQGMTCGSCVRHVRSALLRIDGVAAVDVKLAEGKVRVRHDADDATVPRLVEALAEAGYPATPAA